MSNDPAIRNPPGLKTWLKQALIAPIAAVTLGIGTLVSLYFKVEPRKTGTLNVQGASTAPAGFDPETGLKLGYLDLAAYELALSKVTPEKGDTLKLGGETYTIATPLKEGSALMGYVAESKDATIVVVRGAKTPLEILGMLDARWDKFGDEGRTTNFYGKQWESLWPEIKPTLPPRGSDRKIYIVGHSAGVAVADLLAESIVHQTGIKPVIYGFAPITGGGDKAFVQHFKQDGIKEFNFADPYDLLVIETKYRNGIPANPYGRLLIHVSPALNCPRLGDTLEEEYKVNGDYLPREAGRHGHVKKVMRNHDLVDGLVAYRHAFPQLVGSTVARIPSIEKNGVEVKLQKSDIPDAKFVDYPKGQMGWVRGPQIRDHPLSVIPAKAAIQD